MSIVLVVLYTRQSEEVHDKGLHIISHKLRLLSFNAFYGPVYFRGYIEIMYNPVLDRGR